MARIQIRDLQNKWVEIASKRLIEATNQMKDIKLEIPVEIYAIIYSYCQECIRKFNKYDVDLFKTSNNDTTIIPIGYPGSVRNLPCYLVYPSPNGFTKGVHRWSVKYVSYDELRGFRSIGVTTKIYNFWQGRDRLDFPKEDKGSHWNGLGYKWTWKDTQIIEVVLDIDAETVTYYKIEDSLELIKLKQDKIDSNQTYYFALSISSDKRCSVFESVLPFTIW